MPLSWPARCFPFLRLFQFCQPEQIFSSMKKNCFLKKLFILARTRLRYLFLTHTDTNIVSFVSYRCRPKFDAALRPQSVLRAKVLTLLPLLVLQDRDCLVPPIQICAIFSALTGCKIKTIGVRTTVFRGIAQYIWCVYLRTAAIVSLFLNLRKKAV